MRMPICLPYLKAQKRYENNRYTINIPKWYAGESVSLTLYADLCDRRETGIIPVTGELVLKADNLAQVSAAALSINRTGYRVTYDSGSGTGSAPEDPAIHAEGDTVTLKDKPAELKKDGQNFSGWGASGGVNIRDNSFTMPGSDVALQALWGRAYIQKRTNTVTQEPTRRMRNRQAIGYSNAFYATAYRDHIQSITFLNTNEMPAEAVAVWDITDTNFGTAGSVMAAVVVNESDASKYDLYIGAKGGVEAPVSSSSLFSGFSSLTTIKDASNFDTLNVTNMRMMFANCKALTTLDLSGWDTGNVTSMALMFYGCDALTTLDLSRWNTGNVTSMSSMFANCDRLATLNLSGWNTGNVTVMGGMFYWCLKLETLDLSGWNTGNVTNMEEMFRNCRVLKELDLSGWDTSKLTNMKSMFHSCLVPGIGTDHLTVANGCSVTDWNTSASAALTAVTVRAVDGTVLYQGTATASLRAAAMPARHADGKQMLSAEERRETDSPTGKTVEENSSDERISEEKELSGNDITLEESTEQTKAAGQSRETRASAAAEQTGAEKSLDALSASVKNGVTEGGRLSPGQKVEYELELQYIGDEGGRSGELVVTDNIPAGMTYNGDASVSSVQRIDGGIGNILGTVTMSPTLSGNTLTFKVTGLSAGAKIVVTYSCNAPASEPAAYTEYINTASVNDSGLTDEADPVRHYMQKKPSAFYDVTYRYSGRNIPDGVAVPGRMGVAQGESVTLPVPAANGWIFNGWKASGTVVSGTYTLSADGWQRAY